jgi:hypothetical protein
VAHLLNIVGLLFDLSGALLLLWYSTKTKGITQDWEVVYHSSGRGYWYLTASYIGIIFLAFGFFLQVVGNVVGLVIP